MLLERDDKVERAVRTRATNKEDQGGKGHTWAELLNIDRPTHDALRWAEEYSDVYLVRDIFPSRQPQDVDLVVDAGINLYALEHEGRPGK
jgi:hypothetical protein